MSVYSLLDGNMELVKELKALQHSVVHAWRLCSTVAAFLLRHALRGQECGSEFGHELDWRAVADSVGIQWTLRNLHILSSST